VRAALVFLCSRSQIDFRRVAVLAHGDGASVAARVVATDQGVRALALLSPPAEPAAPYPAVSCPVLALSGELDPERPAAPRGAQVPSPAAVAVALPGLDHQLRTAPPDGAGPGESLAPVALERISSWLAEALRR
jgi:hypothetical protein